jgi:hypothetical protein
MLVSERRIGTDVEGRGRGLILCSILDFAWEGLKEEHENPLSENPVFGLRLEAWLSRL